MLYLTRKIGESIVINDDIELTVVEVRGKSIKLGLTFPSDVTVYRREVYDRIQAEKRGEVPPRAKGPRGPRGAAPDQVAATGAPSNDGAGSPTNEGDPGGDDPPLAADRPKIAQGS